MESKIIYNEAVNKYGFVVILVTEFVAKKYGLRREQLFDKNRKRLISEARMYAMYILSNVYKMVEEDIADIFAKRNHSTVNHAKKTIQGLIDLKQLQFNL